MLGNGFVFIFSDITFVSVYSLFDGISSPDMCAKLASGSITRKRAQVRLRVFIGGEYPFEVGWLSVSD